MACYDKIYKINDDLMIIKKNSKYGFVNLKDMFFLKPKYDLIYNFEFGITRVVLDNKFGIIDIKGKIICDFIYNYDWCFWLCKLVFQRKILFKSFISDSDNTLRYLG